MARIWSKPAKMSGLAGFYSFEQPILVHGSDGYVLIDGGGTGDPNLVLDRCTSLERRRVPR